jgi:hypothetical protein
MITPADARLSQAVEALYRIFALPVPAAIEGCPCCTSARSVDVLLTTPLRELSSEQLSSYVPSALLTIGGEDDFRYLLPRILDISVSDPANANCPEIVIGKLALANWRTWSASEQHVVEEFLDAWFESSLARDLAEAGEGWIGTEAESVLCGAARAGLPLRRWLVRLHDPIAAPVLADLKQRFPGRLSAFWKDIPEGLTELSVILSQGQA